MVASRIANADSVTVNLMKVADGNNFKSTAVRIHNDTEIQ